ncbi:thiamine phosphate synthase [Sphingomonas sp. PAMC 26621]|uniref:thiamine phosphate synthase n=1 Tax=Sphingomonas sp. PAMC 26621 TaxID=1112213 RepID=UPI0002FEE433
MAVRHPSLSHRRAFPVLWLMTDERIGGLLCEALARLPRGSGVVFRHHATAPAERAVLKRRIAVIARRRGLVLVDEACARGQPVRIGRAHSVREGLAARRAGAEVVFVSPVYPTRTHPGAPTLGPVRAARIARAVGLPAIALGGMNAARFRRVRALGFAGWAAIDGLLASPRHAQNPGERRPGYGCGHAVAAKAGTPESRET